MSMCNETHSQTHTHSNYITAMLSATGSSITNAHAVHNYTGGPKVYTKQP